jgi:dTDP-glucose 4,6-dehydratase
MKKILILGANSFAGATLVDTVLSNDYIVWGINRSPEASPIFLPYYKNQKKLNYRFHQIHIINDFDKLVNIIDNFSPEYIVDFAGQGMVAESWTDPVLWYETNIIAKVRLFEYLRLKPWLKKYIRISTPEVYGSITNFASEEYPYNPSTPYAVSHTAIDMSLKAFFHNYNFPVVIGRFANFYGPGQQLYRIIPKAILSGLTGEKLPLHGGGQSVRAFIHSRDVANAIMQLIDNNSTIGEIYHFTTSEYISIYDLVLNIANKLNIDFEKLVYQVQERPGKDYAYLMDASKAKQKLNWEAKISLDDGIDETILWIRQHLNDFKQLPWQYIHKS